MMRREVALVSAYDGLVRAQHVGRLLSAEDWIVSYKVGLSALEEIDAFDPETLMLFVVTPDGQESPFVRPWLEAARSDRAAILNFCGRSLSCADDMTVFDFDGWRGDRAQLWRALKRWLEAPHARLDTRVWLKRA